MTGACGAVQDASEESCVFVNVGKVGLRAVLVAHVHVDVCVSIFIVDVFMAVNL